MGEPTKGLRELSLEAADDLPGLWIVAGLGDTPNLPSTTLGWHLVQNDAVLLGAALDDRGVSLPRLSRRLVRVGGFGYHAFEPLARAARTLASLDGAALAMGIAAEARPAALKVAPERAQLSALGRGQHAVLARRRLRQLERAVSRHEGDAAQHYRWLVEMDLGILPDDALGTTLEECAAIQRVTRALEIEATLDLLGTFAALVSYAEHHANIDASTLALGALVPDAVELSGAAPALAVSCVAQVLVRRRAMDSATALPAAFGEFLEGFGERGPSEHEPMEPRWREQPKQLEGVVELLTGRDLERSEARLASARREREAVLQRAYESVGPIDEAVLRSLVTSARKIVLLRSRLHLVRARMLAMLRTAVLDVDRRLVRLIGTEPNSAFFLTVSELLDSTVRPRPELASVARERRAAWQALRVESSPPAMLGRVAANRSSAASDPITGAGFGSQIGVGVAHRAVDLNEALQMPPGAVLVTRALEVGWAPLLLGAAAVVTDTGGITDEGALVAAALGVPLVLGTGDASRRINEGEVLRVDPKAGVVALASGAELRAVIGSREPARVLARPSRGTRLS